MPLPNDGIPRITIQGVKLLEQAVEGDFSGWETTFGNHPLQIPQSELSNCFIDAAKDWHGKPQIVARPWYGTSYPRVKSCGLSAVPYIDFDEIWFPDIRYDHRYECDYIHLKRKGEHFAHAPIFIEDRQLWNGSLVDKEDEEDEDMVDCECGLNTQVAKSKQTGLEAFL